MKYLCCFAALTICLSCIGCSLQNPPACHATFLNATVSSNPVFAKGHKRKGIELSHTNFTINDVHGQKYQVNLDNVFASDYDASDESIPKSYQQSIKMGTNIMLCGRTYNDKGIKGIHWVHTNCDNPHSGPDGYTFINNKRLADNQEYCYLWH